MPDALEQFAEETIEELLKELPAEQLVKRLSPDERLKGLSPEERLKGLSPEERLKGLSPEAQAQLAQLLKDSGSLPNRTADKPEPGEGKS